MKSPALGKRGFRVLSAATCLGSIDREDECVIQAARGPGAPFSILATR